MGIFDFFTGGGENPADKAKPYFDQIPGMEQGYYNPFIQRGNEAYNKSNPIYDQMLKDPAGFLESLMQKYEPSRGFQLKKDQMLKAAGNTAAAGGMRGSLQDIDQEAHLTDMLMGEDMQQWLKNVLGIEDTGLTGNQHLYDTGYDASKNLAGDLSNVFGTQGQLAFQGQREQNKSRSDALAGLAKLFGAGVGGYFGGVPGAKVGAGVGESLF